MREGGGGGRGCSWMVENGAGTAGWYLSLVTGAGRSGSGHPGQQDFGRPGNVGSKIGPEMKAWVRGLSRQPERLAGSSGGGSCSFPVLLPPVVPLPLQASPNERLQSFGVSSSCLTGPGPAAEHHLARFTSPVISFPGFVAIQVPYYSDSCVLPGGRLQDVCGSYYTGGMCQGRHLREGNLSFQFLVERERKEWETLGLGELPRGLGL